MAAALAALPLAEAGVKYASDVSKSIVAQVSDALRVPLLGTETTTTRQTKRGLRVQTTKAALPAWVVVGGLLGGAMALWISGMGLAPATDAHGVTRVTLTQRPRWSFSLFGNGPGAVGSPDVVGPIIGFAEWLFRFTPL